MATFRKNTYVRDANGVSVKFVIGQEVPEWVFPLVKNPKIIDQPPVEAEPVTIASEPAPVTVPKPDEAPAPVEDAPVAPVAPPVPAEAAPAPAPRRRARKTATKPAAGA